jgi:DNA-binding response OmpR family regulator
MNLRKKLTKPDASRQYIATVFGFGYKFDAGLGK